MFLMCFGKVNETPYKWCPKWVQRTPVYSIRDAVFNTIQNNTKCYNFELPTSYRRLEFNEVEDILFNLSKNFIGTP